MTDEERIRELLEVIMETGDSPEAVCANYPELLGEVRSQFDRLHELGARMDKIFPSSDSSTQADPTAKNPGVFPKFPTIQGYEIQSVLGHGGMGVVYSARHVKLNRPVAIKMMLASAYADPVDQARFQREAEAVASLRHPHIVQIYDLGDFEGAPFFTMELVEGGTLSQKLAGHPQPVNDCANMIATLAEAVAAAHKSGIIHRDLKPGNVLISADGTPKISDFGLAQRFDKESQLTATGKQVGTPSYMAPESISGHKEMIGPRTDIYALGAILYEMLTGRPPFTGRTPMETMSRAILVEPVSPARLVSNIPRDIETICLKCLEKKPENRYATASELAEDVHRFIRREPIHARPISTAERTFRWMSRHKGLSAALASVVLLLVLLATGSIIAAAYYRHSEKEQASLASANRKLFEKEEQARKEEQKARELATAAEKLEAAARVRAEKNLYFAQMNLGGLAVESPGGVGRVLSLVSDWQNERPDRRGWEWYYLYGLCHRDLLTLDGHTKGVAAIAWSPDGKKIASAGGEDSTVGIWIAADGIQKFRIGGHTRDVNCVAWSHDGRSIATAGVDYAVHIWDPESGGGRPERYFIAAKESCSIAWSADDAELAVADKQGDISIVDVQTTKSVPLPRQHEGGVLSVAYSPRGKQLASGGTDFNIRIWDMSARKLFSTLRGHRAAVTAVAWSADGKFVASASEDSTVRIWDVATGNPIILKHAHAVSSVAWSPDGKRLVTGGFDQTVKIWDAATGLETATFHGHSSRVTSVAWSPDKAQVASASLDRTIKIWNLATGPGVTTVAAGGSPVYTLSWRGGELSSTHVGGAVKLHAASGTKQINTLGKEFPESKQTLWSPDGKWFACADADGIIRVWYGPQMQNIYELRGHAGPLLTMISDHDGTRIASAGSDGTVRVWNPLTGEQMYKCDRYPARIRSLAFELPDIGGGHRGRWLAAGADDATVPVFDAAGHTAFTFHQLRTTEIRSLSWSSDGKRLAVVGGEHAVVIQSVDENGEKLVLEGHTDAVNDVSWNPDSTRLVTASADGTIRIWDTATGLQLLAIDERRPVTRVAWSEDGLRLASSDSDGGIHIRDATKGFTAGAAPALIPLLDRRIEAAPTDPSLWRFRARVYAMQGDWKSAARDSEQYLKLQSDEKFVTFGFWVAGPYTSDANRKLSPPKPNPPPREPDPAFVLNETTSKTIKWRHVPCTPSGFINLGSLLENQPDISADVLLRVYSAQNRKMTIQFGVDDNIRLWLNGAQINVGSKKDTVDPVASNIDATLSQGWNTLLARVINDEADHTIYLRLLDQLTAPQQTGVGDGVAK